MQTPDWLSSAAVHDRWRATRLAALQGGAFLRALARETLRPPPAPQVQGTLRLQGLHDSLDVLRDDSGVPHIFAQNPDDALFGLGFVHAQDRFWQLEFYRRVGAGRMAEVSGPIALPTDRLMRHVGLNRSAAAAWAAAAPATQARFRPYIDGINAGLVATSLPLEIRILDYEPEPWRTQDSVLWAKLLAFMLSPAWEAQILRARLVEAVGLDALCAVDRGYPSDGPVIAPPGAPYGALSQDLTKTYAAVVAATGLGGPAHGSNNWAVDAAHTESGRALLATDPHLTAVNPAMAYFVHLDCPEFSVAGASLPGLPGFIWGFNRRIAWGPTAGLASTQDLFVEEFEPNSDRYRTPDGWAEAEVVTERIAVRGYPDDVQQIRITRHGPVVSPQIPGLRHALALRSAVLDPVQSGEAILALFSARGIDEFRAAIAGFHEFNLSFGYADVDGRVGMQVSGAIPQRRPGHAWLPAPGWDPAFDWQGYIPRDALPHEFDPPHGRVWSANNAPRPVAELPYAGEFLDPYRAARIGQVLAETNPHTVAAARALQVDRKSLPMLRLRDHLLQVEPANDDERALLALIRDWDGRLEPASVAAAIVAATYSRLLDAVLRAQLGDATAVFLGAAHVIPNLNVLANRTASLLTGLLDGAPAGWFGPVAEAVDGRAVWTAALTRAFRDAGHLLRDRLGKDPQRWTWGRCRPLTFVHGLGEVPALARLFNVGPFPFGGSPNTPFQGGPLGPDPFAPVTAVPVLRLIVEMSDPPRAEFILAGGQVGRRGHRHAHDLIDDWLHGRTRPLLTGRAAIDAAGAQRLTLKPQES
ncbi:MAG: penicillin acylase family protein [Dehalococcoidia bacterium]